MAKVRRWSWPSNALVTAWVWVFHMAEHTSIPPTFNKLRLHNWQQFLQYSGKIKFQVTCLGKFLDNCHLTSYDLILFSNIKSIGSALGPLNGKTGSLDLVSFVWWHVLRFDVLLVIFLHVLSHWTTFPPIINPILGPKIYTYSRAQQNYWP